MPSLAIGTVVVLAGIAWADGDSGRTAELGNVRLWAVSAPECVAYHSYKQPCDDAATRFVRALTEGRQITAIVRGHHERSGRPVLEMHLKTVAGYGVDVGTELLRTGLGCWAPQYDPMRHYGWASECP